MSWAMENVAKEVFCTPHYSSAADNSAQVLLFWKLFEVSFLSMRRPLSGKAEIGFLGHLRSAND